jgi:multisubunit Na+/H+ antiporter MnhB subunit
MGIAGTLAAAAIMILIEKQNMKNKWRKKETTVFFVSLLMGISVCMAWALDIHLLDPVDIITDIYRPITAPFASYMKQFK